jgi:hypothetical protein
LRFALLHRIQTFHVSYSNDIIGSARISLTARGGPPRSCFDRRQAKGYHEAREELMRKTMVLAVLTLALAAASVGALEIAVGAGLRYQLVYVTDFVGGFPLQETTVSLDLRAWPYPLQLGIGLSREYIGPLDAPVNVYETIILAADYWLLDTPLGSLPLRFHLGAGVWMTLPIIEVGVRGTAGLRWTPIPSDRGFEVWLDLVPVLGMYVMPSTALKAGGSAGLGLRYWFGR